MAAGYCSPVEKCYTLILTKGVHLINLEAARDILEAIKNDERIVEVTLDPFGGADDRRRTIIATAHIVALSETDLAQSCVVPMPQKTVRHLGSAKLR